MNPAEDSLLSELREAADRLREAEEDLRDAESLARQMGLPEDDIRAARRAAGLYA